MIIHLNDCLTDEIVNSREHFFIPSEYIEDYGYETFPHDDSYRLPLGFPLCCQSHRNIYFGQLDWYTNFPKCCDEHKILSTRKWFFKDNYKYVVARILKNLVYSLNYISKNCITPEGTSDSCDYIDYCVKSFGANTVGAGRYLSLLKLNIKTCNIPEEYEKVILNHYMSYYSTTQKKSERSFETIDTTFKKWVETIPDLNELKELKKNLRAVFPLELIADSPKRNKFTGLTTFTIKTEKQFITTLTTLTKNILKQYENAHKNNSDIDFYVEQTKSKQKKLLGNYKKQELDYVKIFSTWLKNEIELIQNINKLEMAKYNISGDNNQFFMNESGTQINNIGLKTESINDLIAAIKKENYNIDYKSVEDLENEVKKTNPEKSKLKSLFIKIATELTTKVGVELLKPEIVALIKDLQTVF